MSVLFELFARANPLCCHAVDAKFGNLAQIKVLTTALFFKIQFLGTAQTEELKPKSKPSATQAKCDIQ